MICKLDIVSDDGPVTIWKDKTICERTVVLK